jgi:hypothetical protein
MNITPLQREILAALLLPNSRLRWAAVAHPDENLAGRGLVMGQGGGYKGDHFKGGPIASYTVRQLVKSGYVRPVDSENARPFSDGGPPYRDYHLTHEGRACVAGMPS